MSKLKKIFCLLFITTLLIVNASPVAAGFQFGNSGGGGSISGGSSGGGGSFGCSGLAGNKYYDSGNYITSGALKYQLVYRPKQGSNDPFKNYPKLGEYRILKTVIAQNTGAIAGNKSAVIAAVKNYAANNNYQYVDNSNNILVQKVVPIISGGVNVASIQKEMRERPDIVPKQYIKNGMGVADNLMNASQPNVDEMANKNSYGYRILVQKIVTWVRGDQACAADKANQIIAGTRKEGAAYNDGRIAYLFATNGKVEKDLFMTFDDIGIIQEGDWYQNYNPVNERGYEDAAHLKALREKFGDWNHGYGYNIFYFSTEGFTKPHNYQIDAACQRCDSTDTENKALIVQDTPDWEAILDVKNYPNEDPYKKLKDYFISDKRNGIVCREEIYVNFPNQNNIIAVEPGRMFTVNPSIQQLKNANFSGIPNFKPVRVTKVRQCKGADAKKLTDYANYAKRKFTKKDKNTWGNISFKYTENYRGSQYSNDGYVDMEGYGETYSSRVSGDMLIMTATRNYTLPKDHYQYIYKANGLSIKKATTTQKNSGQYINVGIPNLPISRLNTGDDLAKIQFAYDLPKDDGHKLGTAYTEQNNYFGAANKKANIYEEGKESNLRNSACAKMYGYNHGLYGDCVDHRKSNAVGLRGPRTGFSSCFGKLDKYADGSKPEGYICIIKNDTSTNPPGENPPGNEPCNEKNHQTVYGRDWNPNNGGYCCAAGYKYYPSTKLCVPSNNPPGDNPPGGICKTEEDAKAQNRSWNPVKQKCCEVGTVYNSNTGECLSYCFIDKDGNYYDNNGNKTTLEGYKAVCPDPENVCDDDCEYGCCPSGECAPMPKDENGHIICPGNGNVIYRPIDLKYSFPGQAGTDAGKSRTTGSNWCEYNIKTKEFKNCNSNNNIAKYYINNKNTEVYSGRPLYEVKLDSKAISSIRNYNRNQKSQGGYDDFTLKCDSKGKKCISQFLRGKTSASVNLENDSLCKSTNKSEFNRCDDSKKGSR